MNTKLHGHAVQDEDLSANELQADTNFTRS